MIDWRLLLFIVFGIFQPIIAEGLVDGKDCCVQFPQFLQSDTRFSNGPNRFTKAPEEQRLNARHRTRNFDTGRYQESSTRSETDTQNQNNRNILQYRERYNYNNQRVSVTRDSFTERAINTERSSSKLTRREHILEQPSRTFTSDLKRSFEISESRNKFAQRLNNDQDRRLMRNRYTRDGFERNSEERLNNDQGRRLTINRYTRDGFERNSIQRLNNDQERHINRFSESRDRSEEQNERRNRQTDRVARSLSNSRESRDHLAYTKHTRSIQYQRDTTATTRFNHKECVLTRNDNDFIRNDERRNLRLREHYFEHLNENHKDYTRDKSSTDRHFASAVQESSSNNERRSRNFRSEMNENRNEQNRLSRSVSRNRAFELSRNDYRNLRNNDRVVRSAENILGRTDRFGDRSSNLIDNEKSIRRKERLIQFRVNTQYDVRDQNSQLKTEIGINRNTRIREIVRLVRKNERTRKQEGRDNPQRVLDEETEKSELNYRRYTDASTNRARGVLRVSDIRRELRSNHMSPRDRQVREVRNDIEFRSSRRVHERNDNRIESALRDNYLQRLTETRNGDRRVNIERQSRSNYLLNIHNNAIDISKPDNGFELKLHHLFYIIQGIYLLSILINISTKDKDFSKNDRLSSWLSTRMALKID